MGQLRVDVPKRYRRLLNEHGVGKYVHQIRAERALGKALPPDAVVHHADGSKSDDAPLVVCQDEAYHRLLHQRTRIIRAGGNPNTQRVCSKCKLVKDTSEFHRSTKACFGKYCKPCARAYTSAWMRGRRPIINEQRREAYRNKEPLYYYVNSPEVRARFNERRRVLRAARKAAFND